jgi:hypothetical protein
MGCPLSTFPVSIGLYAEVLAAYLELHTPLVFTGTHRFELGGFGFF